MDAEAAFPHLGEAHGMDLRDYFAAKAMQSIILCDNNETTVKADAEYAYLWADIMMAVRAAHPPPTLTDKAADER